MSYYIGFGRIFDDAGARYRLTATADGSRLGMDVSVMGPIALAGPADIAIDGVSPDADTLGSGAVVPVMKIRLGAAGMDDGLVDDANRMPVRDEALWELTLQNHELLEAILEELTG